MAPATAAIGTSVEVEEILDAIGERITGIRALPAPPNLKRGFQTHAQFKAGSEFLDEKARLEAELLKDLCMVLDLCSNDDDLLQIQLDLLGEGVLGYYNSVENSVTVVTEQGPPGPLSWLTYAHEYTHALQDQQFGHTTTESEDDNFDSSKAVLALTEGDSRLAENLFYESLPSEEQTLVAEALRRRNQVFISSPAARQAPPIIRKTFGWENAEGGRFVFRLHLNGGFDAIDRLYQHPPQSTEQIIHPEKYLAGEGPRSVSLPGPGDGSRRWMAATLHRRPGGAAHRHLPGGIYGSRPGRGRGGGVGGGTGTLC